MISDETAAALVIRPAEPGEAGVIAGLHARARATYYPDGLPPSDVDWTDAWRGAIERPDGEMLCGVRDGEIVAVASFRTPEGGAADTVKLYQFHVAPNHWRAGLGSALHAACVERWLAGGRRAAVLDVHVDNRRAQAFYARQGWVPDPAKPPAEDDHHLFLRWTPSGE
ncbi:GNAT family N-acetyltransferase [Streptomyces bauhiniae]|uniref:GNAT family N-acetyltransferase n=1 Tax=Streptomyces bauhiniae TaxID=2340725 RepID=UPI003334031F